MFHQCLWRHFLPIKEFKEFAKAIYPADNCEIVSYPGLDPFVDKKNILTDIKAANWNKSRSMKVIWAPHHTIEKSVDGPFFSTFLIYAKIMYGLACQAENLQICFKPHPALKKKLYNHEEWGRERTDEYYSRWANAINGNINESIYHDFFLSADAMVLDSVSFISEFCSLKKPLCFLIRPDKMDYSNYFNEVGNKIFKEIPKAKSWEEIMAFLNNLANGSDKKMEFSIDFNLSSDESGKKIVKSIEIILDNK